MQEHAAENGALAAYRGAVRKLLRERIWKTLRDRQEEAEVTRFDAEGQKRVRATFDRMKRAFGLTSSGNLVRHFNDEVIDCWESWPVACIIFKTELSDTVPSRDELHRTGHIAALSFTHTAFLGKPYKRLAPCDYEVLIALRTGRLREWELAQRRNNRNKLQRMVDDFATHARETTGITPSVTDVESVQALYDAWEETFEFCSVLLMELEPYHVPSVDGRDSSHTPAVP